MGFSSTFIPDECARKLFSLLGNNVCIAHNNENDKIAAICKINSKLLSENILKKWSYYSIKNQ